MEIMLKGLLLGLATGASCLGSCLPVLFPITVGEEGRGFIKRAWLLAEFSAGRLVAYLMVGALVGFLGARLESPLLHRLFGLVTIGLALAMIMYGIGRGFPALKGCGLAARFAAVRHLPVLLGVFTGFSLCPPFLLAIDQAFRLGRVDSAIGFFFAFFIATSLFLIPTLLFIPLARIQPMRWIAQFAAILSGILFLLSGLNHILPTT